MLAEETVSVQHIVKALFYFRQPCILHKHTDQPAGIDNAADETDTEVFAPKYQVCKRITLSEYKKVGCTGEIEQGIIQYQDGSRAPLQLVYQFRFVTCHLTGYIFHVRKDIEQTCPCDVLIICYDDMLHSFLFGLFSLLRMQK